MHAQPNFWLEQYLAAVTMGIMTWQEKLHWKQSVCGEDEAGRGRSSVSKRRKCYSEPNETPGRALLQVPVIQPSTDFNLFFEEK